MIRTFAQLITYTVWLRVYSKHDCIPIQENMITEPHAALNTTNKMYTADNQAAKLSVNVGGVILFVSQFGTKNRD